VVFKNSPAIYKEIFAEDRKKTATEDTEKRRGKKG
jgi:hypothetical protein